MGQGRSVCLGPRIAGCPLLGTPRTDPDRPDSSIRLLPRVFDGEALIGPGMKHTRCGKPAVGQFRHPIPREAVLLAAPPKPFDARGRPRNAGTPRAPDYLWVSHNRRR